MLFKLKCMTLFFLVVLSLDVRSQTSFTYEYIETLVGKEQSVIDTNLLIISARLIDDSTLKKTKYVYSQSMLIDTNSNIIYLFLSKTTRRIAGQTIESWIIKDAIKIESFSEKLMTCSVSCHCSELENRWYFPVIERLNYQKRRAEVSAYFAFDYNLERILYHEVSYECIIEIIGDYDYCW